MDGRQIRRHFVQFNEQYFGNRLPPYSIRVVPRITRMGEDGVCHKKRRLIEIRQGLPDDEAIGTLLHEMAHAATNHDHGMQFKREIIRLREAGAPLSPLEMRTSLDDWDGKRVTKKMFRAHVDDVLMDLPEVTLSQAIQHFISNVGGPATISTFKKKYPWAGAVLWQAKKAKNPYDRLLAKIRADLAAKHSHL